MSVPAGGLTVLGIPEVVATVKTSATDAQLAARLWDVAPDGRQVLTGRGVARLRPGLDGPLRFALLGTGYRFAPGHIIRLELTGSDTPFLRPSNQSFSVQVTDLRAVLPVRGASSGRVCRSRRSVTIHLHRSVARGRHRVRQTLVFVAGRLVQSLDGARRTVRVSLRDQQPGTYDVRVVRRSRAGDRTAARRTLRSCAGQN